MSDKVLTSIVMLILLIAIAGLTIDDCSTEEKDIVEVRSEGT